MDSDNNNNISSDNGTVNGTVNKNNDATHLISVLDSACVLVLR